MSHRRLVLVALGAASLFAAAAPAHAAPPLEPQLVNLQIAEADAPNASALVVNVALDRPNPYPFPISVGVGDYSHIVVRGFEPAAHLRHRDGGLRLQAARAVPAGVGARAADRAASPSALLGDTRRRGRREHQHPHLRALARRSTSATTTSTSCCADNDPLGTTGPLAPPLVLLPERAAVRARRGLLALPGLAAARASGAARGSVLRRATTRSTHGSATPGVDYVTFAPFRLYFAAGANSAALPGHDLRRHRRPRPTRRSTSAPSAPGRRAARRQRPRPGAAQRRLRRWRHGGAAVALSDLRPDVRDPQHAALLPGGRPRRPLRGSARAARRSSTPTWRRRALYGPVTVNATKSRISFQVRMRFAGIERPRRRHIVATFVLVRELESAASARRVHPAALLRPPARAARRGDVDDEVRAWLAEAYAVGEQRHLS